MLNSMDHSIARLTLADPLELGELELSRRTNFTLYLTEAEVDDVSRVADPEYEQFLADVWVGIVLTLMVLSCVCCMCSCLLYHKFQQWKRNILEARRRSNNVESGQSNDTESLPSYTIVSGLPSYDEAIEQLRKVQIQSKENLSDEVKSTAHSSSEPWVPHTPPPPMTRLSVSELFQLYKNSNTTQTQSSVDCKT